MADLEYDAAALRDLDHRISQIVADLRDDRLLTGYDVEDLAHRLVVDAVHELDRDWNDKRERLAKRLEALAEAARTSAAEYTKADWELASKLKESEEKSA